MVRRCSFGDCGNKVGSGVNFYTFPSGSWQSLQWSRAVKSTRTDWDGPKPYSVVCSQHFDNDSFEGGLQNPVLAKQFGFHRRPKLKTNAVPRQSLEDGNRSYQTETGSPSFKLNGIHPFSNLHIKYHQAKEIFDTPTLGAVCDWEFGEFAWSFICRRRYGRKTVSVLHTYIRCNFPEFIQSQNLSECPTYECLIDLSFRLSSREISR